MAENRVDSTSTVRNVLETSHGDVLLGMLRKLLEQMMDAEVAKLCGADYGDPNSVSALMAPPARR